MASGAITIERGRTAMRRYRCSRPIALALSDGLISKKTSVFDYGCGYGGDVRYLQQQGVAANGWDPAHRPDEEVREGDVVNLAYVLNVIEDPTERKRTLKKALSLARQLLVVSVRVDKALEDAEEFGDGVRTKSGTFQKLYTQAEFREYLTSVLDARVHVASLGIAYVFKDEEAEQAYIASRAFTRRLEYRTDLIERFAEHGDAQDYVGLANELGRVPLPEEFDRYDALIEAFGTPQRVERLTRRHIDEEAFSGSREQRREDVLTFLAMLRLDGLKAPKLSQLAPSVRADIKAIWKSYAKAKEEGQQFLFSIGQPEVVSAACAQAEVGKLLPEDLYIHASAEDELPALLRVIAFAARQVVGEVDFDILKISRHGRSVSFLSYEDFDGQAHPRLLRSLRVYLPRASYQIRRYDESDNPPILHRKDAMVSPTYPHYNRFRKLTEAEEDAGLLSSRGIGFRQGWEALLEAHNLRVEGHQLVSQ